MFGDDSSSDDDDDSSDEEDSDDDWFVWLLYSCYHLAKIKQILLLLFNKF